MFWKTGRSAASGAARGAATSIALRMAVWYALSAFALVFAATGVLYWVLVRSQYQEDLRVLADNLNNARLILKASPPQSLSEPPEWRPAWATGQQPQIYLRVLDRRGRTIVETPGMSVELGAPPAAQLAAMHAPQSRKRELVSRDGRPFLALVVRVASRDPDKPVYFIQVAMDRAHDEYLLARYRERLWLVLGASLIACALLGYLIARGGMRPIEGIGRTAERISSSTLHERIGAAGLPAELAGLAETFNRMLDRLQQSFQRVSQFSDDVAHELRTPVNNLRGEIEVALSRARSDDEYRRILASGLEECERISRLIGSLLFLARSESASEPLQRERIEVARELATVREFYEAPAAEAGVSLELCAPPGLSARVDRTLFQQAIGNLVSNAIAHTPRGGAVGIEASAQGDALSVGVRDTGCGIAAEHLPRIFDRFYRADRARSGAGQNVGLGLALVKSIVERHGGTLRVESELRRGTRVSLAFPRADDDFVMPA